MPRLIAWVASVCRSWCGVTCPIPAALAALATASSTRCLPIRRPRSMNSHGSRRPAGRLATHSSSSVLELRVQRDVAVGAQLPERHVQPVRGADLHHRVDGEIEELALAQPGAGEELDREAGERVGVLAGGAQQLRRGGVVDEPRQRFIAARDVTGEHQHAGGSVLAVPLAEALQAHPQRAELLGQPDASRAARRGARAAAARWRL